MNAKSLNATSARCLLGAAALLGSSAAVQAVPQTFFIGPSSAYASNSAARAAFLADTKDIVTETFETVPSGRPSGALSVFGSQAELTQSRFASGSVFQGATEAARLNGRFSTTPGCNPSTACKWWDSAYNFDIQMQFESSAVGFFITDLGDVGFPATMSLDLWKDGNVVRSGISLAQATPADGLLFFGYIDDQFTFNRVTFNINQSTPDATFFDAIGVDDVMMGLKANNNPTPVSAPASLGLVLLGLGLMTATRRQRAAQAGR